MNAPGPRMNVLFIICDDLNDWVLHPAGHPQVKTPNIDRLRNRSVNFSNAHAAVPVCGPSRKCLFSGLYPQTIDSYDFAPWKAVPALENCVPLPLHFRNNGYGVYGAGKLLHEGQGGISTRNTATAWITGLIPGWERAPRSSRLIPGSMTCGRATCRNGICIAI